MKKQASKKLSDDPRYRDFFAALLSSAWNSLEFVSAFSSLAHEKDFIPTCTSALTEKYKSSPPALDAFSRAAFLLWGEGFKNEAREFWKRDIDLDRISWYQYLKYADTFAEEGDIDKALELVATVYSKFPDAAGGYSGLAWRVRNSCPEKAAELFKEDVRLERISPEFMGKYGLFLAGKGDYDRAAELVLEAGSEDASKTFFIHKFAEILFRCREWNRAVELYKKAPFANWFRTQAQLPETGNFKPGEGNVLYAFYDLAACPLSFDFAVFLGHAELYRIQQRLDSVKVIIVPATPGRFPCWYPLSDEEQYWRLRNIIIPCCSMLPSCDAFSVCASRDEALFEEAVSGGNIFPKDYSVLRPTCDFYFMSRCLGRHSKPYVKVSEGALAQIGKALLPLAGGRKVITLTLRESNTVNKNRNSDISEWCDFVRHLDDKKFFPVVLRDQDKAFSSGPEDILLHNHLPEAIWNLELRAALYQLSYLNLGVNNGPMMFCLLNPLTRCLVFKICSAGSDVSSAKYISSLIGLNEGEQFPFCSPFQRFVWKDDRSDIIKEEFKAMYDKIEAERGARK